MVDLEEATIRGVQVEYTHTPAQKGVVQAATAKTVEAAREASNDPGLLLRAKEMRVVDSTVGFVRTRPARKSRRWRASPGPSRTSRPIPSRVVVKLLQNAFLKAILPGFDEQVRLTGRRK